MTDPAHRLNDDDRSGLAPAPDPDRPSWLVSADEGSESEVARNARAMPAPELRLTTASEITAHQPDERGTLANRGTLVPRPAEQQPEKPAGPVAWSAAASSVPRLSLVAPAALPPPATPEPEEETIASTLSTFESDADPAAAPPRPVVARARARRKSEPLWLVALDAVQSNRQVQLLVGGVVLLVVALLVFWPRSEPGVSLSALRKDPARWDSQQVRVHGRIGDVFPLGGGYAFYLHQGRDTMVVFTRSRVPVRRKKTEVVGSVSTGFLDGVPRQAIFEEPQPK